MAHALKLKPNAARWNGRRFHMATATARKPSAPKPLPPPNSDFYRFAETLSADEMAVLKKVRAFMETKVAPIINKYWVEDAFPFELLPAFKELNLAGVIRLLRRESIAGRPDCDGDGAGRCLNRDLLRRPQRPGDGFDRDRRIGGAETKVATADGAHGKDRLLRPHRAAGGLGSRRRPDHDGQARRRHLGPQRPEAVDRQRALVRYLDHLGARRGRQPGQGLYRRKQDHARLQRREDAEQDGAEGGPERSDHDEGLPGAGSKSSGIGCPVLPRHRARAAWDA